MSLFQPDRADREGARGDAWTGIDVGRGPVRQQSTKNVALGYRGARGAVGVPFYGRDPPKRMRECNAAHAKVRAIGERAIATLKTWQPLSKLRCCPQRATALTQAILVLQHAEDARH